MINPTLKLALMIAGTYVVLYAIAYLTAEIIIRFTKEEVI
jgi:hypothetical protein